MEKTDMLRMIKSAVFGVLLAAGVLLLLLILAAFLISGLGIPLAFSAWVALISLLLAAFCGGIFSAMLSKKRGMLSGMLCGIFLACCWLLAFLLFGKAEFSIMILGRPLLCIGAGAIGGIIGINRRQQRIRY